MSDVILSLGFIRGSCGYLQLASCLTLQVNKHQYESRVGTHRSVTHFHTAQAFFFFFFADFSINILCRSVTITIPHHTSWLALMCCDDRTVWAVRGLPNKVHRLDETSNIHLLRKYSLTFVEYRQTCWDLPKVCSQLNETQSPKHDNKGKLHTRRKT